MLFIFHVFTEKKGGKNEFFVIITCNFSNNIRIKAVKCCLLSKIYPAFPSIL